MGNMLFAVVTAWVVYWVGVPAGPSERSTAVGYVATNSAAYARGLRIGDEILSVNDVAVRKWSDFRVETALSREATLRVRSPDGAHRRLTVPTEKGLFGELTVAGVEARDLCSVLSVERGMTAETAGLRPGDVISEFAGQEVFSKAHLIGLVGAHEGRTVPIRFKRQAGERAEVHTATVTPALDPITGQVRIGIQFSVMAVEHDLTVHPFPSEQLRGHVATTLRFLRALVTPREASAATKAVGGPVAIGASLWLISKASIMLAISFTGMLNVNLAILNLLPIPVLDGGHILFSLWELITRRPVNAKLANGLVNAFAAVLIALMVLLSLRDIARYTPAGRLVAGVLNGSTNRPAAPAAERGGASP
jgi:regulator of sigma E protease